MSDTPCYPSDVAFTPAVKAVQARKGSREAYARVEQGAGWRTGVDADLAAFLGNVDSFYLATASACGQPYIQHRGGPKGFVKILDSNTLAFADYRGNRQYITQGNLGENPKAQLFVMDYAHRRRVKIWGDARVVDDDPALLTSLMPAGYKARPEQVILFKITAWDTTARSTSRKNSTPRTSPRCWPPAMPGLPNWKRSWHRKQQYRAGAESR